jgi:hypothetical protein
VTAPGGEGTPARVMTAYSYGCPAWALPLAPRETDPVTVIAALAGTAQALRQAQAALPGGGEREWKRWAQALQARDQAREAVWVTGEEALAGQLRLACRLWNRLVEVTRGHERARAAVWASDPAVAAAQETLDAARAAVAACHERIRVSRQADRTTVPRDADKQALDEARAAARAAREARDAAREAAFPRLRARFAAAAQARLAGVKAAAAEATEAGLGWAACNDITWRRFPAALQKVDRERAAGRPAELRFRRWDGTGTVTVQVMGGAGIPPRTLPALNSGRHPRSAVMRLQPWRDPSAGRPKGAGRHGTLTLTAGRSRRHGPLRLQIPVVLDRYMPADADIAEVKVTRFREGTRHRLRVSAACYVPAPPGPPPGGATVAVRLSWRAAGGGWVTAAQVGSSSPLPPLPRSLEHAVRGTAGGPRLPLVRVAPGSLSAEVLYYAGWRRLLERGEAIQGVRGQNTDILREKVTAALRDDPALAAAVKVTAAEVARWRAPRRFAALARRWPAGHPLRPLLEEWRRRDRHLQDYQACETAQVLAARRDAWRCTAAWLCAGASAVVIDGTRLDAEKRAPGDDEEDPEGARGARRLLHRSAPGELRAAVEAAAARRGIPVTILKAAVEPAAGGGA